MKLPKDWNTLSTSHNINDLIKVVLGHLSTLQYSQLSTFLDDSLLTELCKDKVDYDKVRHICESIFGHRTIHVNVCKRISGQLTDFRFTDLLLLLERYCIVRIGSFHSNYNSCVVVGEEEISVYWEGLNRMLSPEDQETVRLKINSINRHVYRLTMGSL